LSCISRKPIDPTSKAAIMICASLKGMRTVWTFPLLFSVLSSFSVPSSFTALSSSAGETSTRSAVSSSEERVSRITKCWYCGPNLSETASGVWPSTALGSHISEESRCSVCGQPGARSSLRAKVAARKRSTTYIHPSIHPGPRLADVFIFLFRLCR